MSQYYNPQRTKNLYDSNFKEPFRLSRSKIDLFLQCPRCFYSDRKLGIGRPPGFPFALNSAVDTLLKQEFDIYRAKGTKHPFMETNKIDAVPFQHEKLEEWRDARTRGITYLHKPTNLLITGGIDDIWVNPEEELIIVDYKATSKNGEVSLDADWQISYKRQMEIYQWLFRKNGFKVSDTSYFVYCNGKTDVK
ncbi:MAG: PD-(D/E)XK nuclease family protein, partial [Candidatus Pacebacteria bacterium]|nr:PD-(D/E)XK nuclease family protein [Candidatus Paceibacterota bacterium]